MFAKRPAPVIGKLPNSFISGGNTCWDASTSPKSPLEYKILSPRGPINCDLSGIGLGIVAAMEKYSDPSKTQVPANKSSSGHLDNKSRSDPVTVNHFTVGVGPGSLEDYTIVTGRGSDNQRFSRLYYDGSDSGQIQKKKIDSDCRRRRRLNSSCHVDDFLSNCDMCLKKLHGKDIYMYRGEKGYCSTECRLKQIMMDENKEKYCKSTVSTSPCQKNGRIFFSPEILVDAI